MAPPTNIILALGLLFAAHPVWALPQYALKEGKQCVYCHYDPRGGGPTNARGRYYAQHFTLEGYIEKKKSKKPKKSPTPPVPTTPPSTPSSS